MTAQKKAAKETSSHEETCRCNISLGYVPATFSCLCKCCDFVDAACPRYTSLLHVASVCTTVEPRFNEVAGDRQNMFVEWRVRYIEVLFHTFYCNFGRDIEIISFVISRISLNRGSLNRGSTVHTFLSLQHVVAT